MKAGKVIFAATLVAMLAVHGPARAETLTIVIEDIRQASGTVEVEVLAGRLQFDGDGAAARLRQAAEQGTMTLVVDDILPGEYALRVLHDINGNGELDMNLMGIPVEPYAFSNNARGTYGPAKWEDVRFMIKGNTTQVVRLVQ